MTEFSNFTQKIQAQIKSQEPINPWWFRFRSLGLGLVLSLLILVAIYGLSLFIFDLQGLQILTEFSSLGVGDYLSLPLFEVLVLALILGFLGYFLYRQTDWFGVRHSRILLGIILGFILVGSFIFISLPVSSQVLDDTQNVVDAIPYRANRLEKVQTKLQDKSIFVGKVTKINLREKTFIVKNRFDEKTFSVEKLKDLPKRSELVAVKYEQSGDVYNVKEVKRLTLALAKKLIKLSEE